MEGDVPVELVVTVVRAHGHDASYVAPNLDIFPSGDGSPRSYEIENGRVARAVAVAIARRLGFPSHHMWHPELAPAVPSLRVVK